MPTHDVLETLKAEVRHWTSVVAHGDTIEIRARALERLERLRDQIADLTKR